MICQDHSSQDQIQSSPILYFDHSSQDQIQSSPILSFPFIISLSKATNSGETYIPCSCGSGSAYYVDELIEIMVEVTVVITQLITCLFLTI